MDKQPNTVIGKVRIVSESITEQDKLREAVKHLRELLKYEKLNDKVNVRNFYLTIRGSCRRNGLPEAVAEELIGRIRFKTKVRGEDYVYPGDLKIWLNRFLAYKTSKKKQPSGMRFIGEWKRREPEVID